MGVSLLPPVCIVVQYAGMLSDIYITSFIYTMYALSVQHINWVYFFSVLYSSL